VNNNPVDAAKVTAAQWRRDGASINETDTHKAATGGRAPGRVYRDRGAKTSRKPRKRG
jgi:hypothetical protein